MEPDTTEPRALPSRRIDRRQALRLFGLAGVGGVLWAGCGSDAGSTSSPTTAASPTTAGPTTSPAASASTTATSAAEAGGWAVGGTDLISVPFPDDSIFEAAGTCPLALTTGLTEGPCYYEEDTGTDISAGLTGLPMQLSLRLIDADCEPVADHVVEVWHCDTEGLYSGDTSASGDAARFRGDFCTSGDEFAGSNTYYRGMLTSDAAGRVDFLSCFPGWYPTRTLHIHVAVSDPSGQSRIISQLCFADELVTEICTTHELYADRGDQDTPLAGGRDMFFPRAGFEEFLLTVGRNPDGTMLAYHTIQVL
ncbi:MAG: intradiol ring-cleavage dioxygenase [Actinomycetota bacterium]